MGTPLQASKKGAARAAKGGGGSAGAAAGSSFRQFTSPGGLTVLVGRNNKQNDVLSHQVANPQVRARCLPQRRADSGRTLPAVS